MKREKYWVVAWAVMIILPLVTSSFDLVPHYADLSFLIVFLFSTITLPLWEKLAPRFDCRNDVLIAYLTHVSLFCSMILAVVFTPLIVFLTGWPWYWIGLFGSGAVLSAEVMALIKLKYF